jgi:hypothetical protein
LTTDEQVALYKQELENLHIEYDNGTISLEEYNARTDDLNNKIAEAEAKHRTF